MTKTDRFKAAISAMGGNVANWDAALRDTYACAESVRGIADPIDRMTKYIDCRRGKKIRKA